MDNINKHCASLDKLVNKFSRHGGTMGLNVFDRSYSMNSFKFQLFLVVYSLYIIMIFSSFGDSLNDFVATAFWCVTLGFLIQSIVKLHIFLGHRPRHLQLTHQFHVIYLRNIKWPQQKSIMDRFLGYSWFAYRALKYMYMATGLTLISVPLLVGLYLGELFLPLEVYLPYLDHKSSPGFQINYALTTYLVYLAANGLTSSESYFVCNIFLGMSHLTMMGDMVDDLNELLQFVGPGKDASVQKRIDQSIKDIVIEHEEHLRFTGLFEQIFSTHALVMVGSASLIIVVCLVVLVKQFGLLGLVLVVMGLSQILFICAMGTAFESSCESLAAKLYQIDWYLMSPKQRKSWWLVMQMADRPHLNTMGGIHLSNLNTFMLVMRNLYSILMMLLKVMVQ